MINEKKLKKKTAEVESGRERTTLTDSRIKLVLSDRLFKSHFVRWG